MLQMAKKKRKASNLYKKGNINLMRRIHGFRGADDQVQPATWFLLLSAALPAPFVRKHVFLLALDTLMGSFIGVL